MPQKIADLDSILHHLGIDPSENSLDIISQLMNRTLQCLGSIRLLFEQLEKERVSKYTTAINEANLYKKKEQEYWAIKKAFAFANDRMIHEIMRSEEIHNLNPARHIIESFPCEESYGKKEWLAAHWTVLGKNNYDHPEHDEQEDISISTRTTTTTDTMEVVSSQLVTPVDEQIVVLDQLADIYPSSFKEVDKEKRSILHIAARLDSIPLFDAVFKNCQRTKGITVKDSNSNGALPLHNAARFSKSSSLFLHVEDEYKEALIMKNKEGMLPLHWAAAKNRSVEIVKHLIDTYPECIRIPNDEGYLPLHLAGQNDCLEVVQAIYDAYPDAISIHDHDGGLPIHHACSITKNLEVVKFLYEKYPPAITQSQEHGITPLHLAASQNDCPELFHFIIDKAPESLYIRDAVGCLPIDCLIMRIKYGVTPQLLECLRIFFRHSKKIVQQSIEQGDNHHSTPAAVHTIMNDLGVELLLRKDYLTRLFLSSLSPLQLTAVTSPDSTLTYQHLLTTLLRTARKNAILLFVQLSRQLTVPPTMKNDHNQFLWEKYVHQYFLNKPTAMETVQDVNKISLWVEKASRLRKEQSIVLTKLCQRFMSPESIEIPTGILRIVIKFL